jgi:hypothetical protein
MHSPLHVGGVGNLRRNGGKDIMSRRSILVVIGMSVSRDIGVARAARLLGGAKTV